MVGTSEHSVARLANLSDYLPAQRRSLERIINAKHLFFFLVSGILLCLFYTVFNLIVTETP